MLKHSNDSLRHYLNEMREYMPPKHNQYIKDIESKSILLNLISDSKVLQSSHDECLEEIRIINLIKDLESKSVPEKAQRFN